MKKFKYLKKPKLRATWKFDAEQADRLMNIRYYIAQRRNERDYKLIQKEKARLSTTRWERVGVACFVLALLLKKQPT
jgi:hypothetical protein